jgi:hypothetical protein
MNAARTPQDLTQTAILYVEFVTSTSVTLNGTPGISITLPSITAGASYYLADYSATAGWQAPVAGPGTTSGNTVSFASNATATLQLSATVPLEIALYSVTGSATPTPTPSPSGSPSPSPSPTPTLAPTPVASPALLTFDAGTPTSAPFTVSETGDTAAFTAGINCTVAPSPSPHPTSSASPLPTPTPTPSGSGFVAALAATSATPTGGVATFTVNSGSVPGTCTVTVTDARLCLDRHLLFSPVDALRSAKREQHQIPSATGRTDRRPCRSFSRRMRRGRHR